MGLLSAGPSNHVRALEGDEETVTLTVEDNRAIRIPRALLHQSALHAPLTRDAWETGHWDHPGFVPGA